MKRILFVLLMSAVLLSACTPTSSLPTEESSDTDLPAVNDPSQPIRAAAGETFTIVMKANASTGYHWEIIGPLEDAHLEFVSREYAGSEPALPGSGGVEVWTFKAVAPGESILVLGNYPPSESESYEEEVRFSIVVE